MTLVLSGNNINMLIKSIIINKPSDSDIKPSLSLIRLGDNSNFIKDEFGVRYSKDGERLIMVEKKYINNHVV